MSKLLTLILAGCVSLAMAAAYAQETKEEGSTIKEEGMQKQQTGDEGMKKPSEKSEAEKPTKEDPEAEKEKAEMKKQEMENSSPASY